jgi:hypothetical protein
MRTFVLTLGVVIATGSIALGQQVTTCSQQHAYAVQQCVGPRNKSLSANQRRKPGQLPENGNMGEKELHGGKGWT